MGDLCNSDSLIFWVNYSLAWWRVYHISQNLFNFCSVRFVVMYVGHIQFLRSIKYKSCYEKALKCVKGDQIWLRDGGKCFMRTKFSEAGVVRALSNLHSLYSIILADILNFQFSHQSYHFVKNSQFSEYDILTMIYWQIMMMMMAVWYKDRKVEEEPHQRRSC